MPTGELNTKIRESVANFYGAMQVMRTGDPFDGLTLRIPAPGGFFKIADVYPVGDMEVVNGQIATVNGLQATSKLVQTVAKRYTGGISYQQWRQGDANSGGAVTRAIMKSAGIVMSDRIRRLSTKLKNGGSDTDLFTTTNEGTTKSAAFATTKYIPRANVTFSNALTGSFTDTAAEVRAAIFTGIAQMDGYVNSINGLIHTPPEQGARYVLMVPPALRQKAADAINPDLSNDAVKLASMGVVYRVNPYLSAANGGSDTVMYLFAVDTVYPALVEGWQGPEEFRNTFGREEAHLILFDQHIFQPYYAMEVDYGSTFNVVRLTNT